MASAYDNNQSWGAPNTPVVPSGYTMTGDGGVTTSGTYRENSEGLTIIQLPGGGRAVVDLVAGTGSADGIGDFTFTPGLTGAQVGQFAGAVAGLSMDARGVQAGSAARGGGAGAGTAAPGGAAGASGSGGPFGSLLRQYGLDELVPMVDGWVRQGLSWAEIESQLLDQSTAAGQVVDRMYPELRLRREAGVQESITIAEIREWRANATNILRQGGFPSTFYDDPTDFRDWIVGNVDITEFAERAGIAVSWAQQAPAETRQALKDLYGVDEGGIAAYVLDKNRALPALQRQQAAASLSGAGLRSGFGGLSVMEAERLASLGVNEQQAEAGFGTLAQSGEVLSPLTGQRGDRIDRDTQLDAVAGDLAAARRIDRAAARKGAAFRGGGGFSEGREGLSGLGSAR